MDKTFYRSLHAKLGNICPSVEVVHERPRIWLLNGHRANVRAASKKSGQKFWFDVTPALYQRRQVEYFLYCCGNVDIAYVFPLTDFERLVNQASLGGEKQVPNFTLYADIDQFEPAGHASARSNVAIYRNAFGRISGKMTGPS